MAWHGTARHTSPRSCPGAAGCRSQRGAPGHPPAPRCPRPVGQGAGDVESGARDNRKGTRDYRGRRSPRGFGDAQGPREQSHGARRAKRPVQKAGNQTSQKDDAETCPKELRWSRAEERCAAHPLPSPVSPVRDPAMPRPPGPRCSTASVHLPFRMVSNACSTLVESSAEVSTNSSPLLSATRGVPRDDADPGEGTGSVSEPL